MTAPTMSFRRVTDTEPGRPGDVRVTVFVGVHAGQRSMCGNLLLSRAEFDALMPFLDAMDGRLAELVDAGRAWRTSLIPKTTSATMTPTMRLLAAVGALDPQTEVVSDAS